MITPGVEAPRVRVPRVRRSGDPGLCYPTPSPLRGRVPRVRVPRVVTLGSAIQRLRREDRGSVLPLPRRGRASKVPKWPISGVFRVFTGRGDEPRHPILQKALENQPLWHLGSPAPKGLYPSAQGNHPGHLHSLPRRGCIPQPRVASAHPGRACCPWEPTPKGLHTSAQGRARAPWATCGAPWEDGPHARPNPEGVVYQSPG